MEADTRMIDLSEDDEEAVDHMIHCKLAWPPTAPPSVATCPTRHAEEAWLT